MIFHIIIIILCLLILCVKTSDAIFLPGLMFPLLIGRGSLYGVFGLIGVGMCYFLAVLSLSSIDYLHKRRRVTLNRIETLQNDLRNQLLNSPLLQQFDDYDYSLQTDNDYYEETAGANNYDDKKDLYYKPPNPPSPQPIYEPKPSPQQNRYNGQKYRQRLVPEYEPQFDQNYAQPYPQSPPFQRKRKRPPNRYQNENQESSVYYGPGMGYQRLRPPNRRYMRRRMKRSLRLKKIRRFMAFLLKLRNSSPSNLLISYKELLLIRQKMFEINF